MNTILEKLILSGKSVWPIIEGGKGIGASDGFSSGAFAACGAIGTFSGVSAKLIDDNGEFMPIHYTSNTRNGRHDELMEYSIKAAISQAQVAYNLSKGEGRIHMNILWEMAGVQRILNGVLSKAKGLIHGITCGAGMPYKLAEIATQYKVYYYPIVSSMKAFRILWKRSYRKFSEFLGGVVYEDPWLAGGHNGLSNTDTPDNKEDPYPRLVAIRSFMNESGLNNVPIIMAGGVWHLKDWQKFIDNPEIGPIAFQFGTRPLLTQESPIPIEWKKMLLKIKKDDVLLHKFSPTGFYSSAFKNNFINELVDRSSRQVEFSNEKNDISSEEVKIGRRGKNIFVKNSDVEKINSWMKLGYTEAFKTPDNTVLFLTPEKFFEIRTDQINCMGCLSHCKFSNWKDHDDHTTGEIPDPRSFCIQKTLQSIVHNGNPENELAFAGHNAYKFSEDPFYKNGYIPTVKELIERILTGN
jgi:NAD(P)H-dependent flavin oxidoreductase YrpB (nitropropane dioxygenase family)